MTNFQHCSRKEAYRAPFGALTTGSSLTLRVRARTGLQIDSIKVNYIYGLTEFYQSFQLLSFDQAEDGFSWYKTQLTMPDRRGLFFYWFEIAVAGHTSFLIPDCAKNDGSARETREVPLNYEEHALPIPKAWQVTVYDQDLKVPDWFKGGVIYQIFPDRFKRGKNYNPDKLRSEHNYPERIYHENWLEDVDIKGVNGYEACDFFAGNLQGIIEELDYIASLGTTVIYLNPIFRSKSNHRYDTGDYFQIDPVLGDLDDFHLLCSEASKRGMRIILDGVFSHTGADSRYFNKYGRYKEVGAWQASHDGVFSPYSSWYHFYQHHAYDSWWGFPDLPNVEEMDLAYYEFINGEDGVARYWLRQGASGWRLDVSDELPDPFIRGLRQAVLAEKTDAVLLGEIWEDASCKISYGSYRDFILGKTHDSSMGYPFRKALLDWLSGRTRAEDLANDLDLLREHYPKEILYATMNLISSHDTPRAIMQLSGAQDPGDRPSQQHYVLGEEQKERGLQLMQLAVLFQMGFPGMASIYYGDEYGAEGFRDPFNRRTFRPDQCSGNYFENFRRIACLREEYPVLGTGHYRLVEAAEDKIVIARYLVHGKDAFDREVAGPDLVYAAFNRSDQACQLDLEGKILSMPARSGLVMADGEVALTVD